MVLTRHPSTNHERKTTPSIRQMFFGWIMLRLRQVAGVVEERRSPAMVNKPMASVITIPFRITPGVNNFFVINMDKPPKSSEPLYFYGFPLFSVSLPKGIILILFSSYNPFFLLAKDICGGRARRRNLSSGQENTTIGRTNIR